MTPRFRTDLSCSREEQQGVVFYRIDDPKTQTSFRLYEIEYLIAQKLDGKRSLPQIIAAVKAEFNFDISETDLNKFITQLESMGFVVTDDAAAGAEPAEAEDATMVTELEPMGDDEATPAIDLARPAAQAAPSGTNVDTAELERLLKTAFQHIRQGYIVHARDYFLAAKELNPGDERLQTLVGRLEIMGDASGPAEVEYLWNEASRLFPDIAGQVGVTFDGSTSPGASLAELGAGRGPVQDENLRSRVTLFLLALAIIIGGGGVLVWAAKTTRLFGGPPQVRVTTLDPTRVSVYYAGAANSVSPANEIWLAFESDGKVAPKPPPVTSGHVDGGQLLASLQLHPKAMAKINKLSAALKRAEAAHAKVAKKVEALQAQRTALEAERNTADEKLRELLPKSVLRRGGVSKRDIEKWRGTMVKANKKLAALAKKERQPRAQLAKADKQLAAARKALEAAQATVAPKLLRAPFAGDVVEAKLKPGEKVKRGDKLVLLRDSLEAKIEFTVEEPTTLQAGGQVLVALGRAAPSRAKVADVKRSGGKTLVSVRLVDPTGGVVNADPGELRLVREVAESVFRVPKSALFTDPGGAPHVFVLWQGRAIQRAVEVVLQEAEEVVIRDKSGALKAGEKVVTQYLGEGGVGQIESGVQLEVAE